MTPLTSVIVPCHQAARHLPIALASAQRNTDDRTEWVLVDDGSTDRTAELLDGFRPVAGQRQVLTTDRPSGVAAARSLGVAAARGRYLAFLDADDWFAPGHVQRLVRAVEELDVDFVRCDHVQVTGTTRSLRRVPEGRRGRPLPAHEGIDVRPGLLSAVDAPNIWAGIYQRSLAEHGLLDVEPGIRTAEDRLMIWRLHLHADRYAVVDLDGYRYRREVAGSLTAIGDDRRLDFFDAYAAVEAELDAEPDFDRFRPKLVSCVVDLVAHHEAHRDRFEKSVHRRFRRRARAVLDALPRPMVEEAVRALPAKRAAAVHRVR